ncbi:MAG: family 20 glycosylhydrolase [Planctomycetota bacterium]
MYWNVFVILCCLGFSTNATAFDFVPSPVNTTVRSDEPGLVVPATWSIAKTDDAAWQEHLQLLAEHLQHICSGKQRVQVVEAADANIVVRRNESLGFESYTLQVNSKQIVIEASSLKGLAHASATLMQFIGTHRHPNPLAALPAVRINDSPAVSYRSFMVDLGRNPHSFEVLKETIDLLWFYKIDSLHLHLTDDQRFAWPSKAYPKLWDGLITWEQFQELEKYAVLRGVTLIPELEVPGHSTLLRKHYPEVFGESPTALASEDTAFEGITTLLDDLLEVFQSTPYIHIGGDEAFGVPEDLQRKLINRLHDYLRSKDRQTVVWEGPGPVEKGPVKKGPGEGDHGVHKDVIHLNWRTINYPADQMIKDGYRVVNATWDPLYLVDHYPRINFTMTSPEHLYQTLSLTRFGHVNPGIRTFANPIEVEPSEQLLGFCMPWWEGREVNYAPQCFPRIIPFADVSWNPPTERDFPAFSRRRDNVEAVRRSAFYPVEIRATDLVVPDDGVFHESTTIELKTRPIGREVAVCYTLDGSVPKPDSKRYDGPFELAKSATIRAAAFESGTRLGHTTQLNLTAVSPVNHLALGKPVSSTLSSAAPFSVERLTDGGTGDLDFYLAYPAEPEPVTITVDLESVQSIQTIVVHAYTVSGSYEKYRVEISRDGKDFTEVASRLEKPEEPLHAVTHTFAPQEARYIRVISQGNKGYVFDSFSKLIEIEVH